MCTSVLSFVLVSIIQYTSVTLYVVAANKDIIDEDECRCTLYRTRIGLYNVQSLVHVLARSFVLASIKLSTHTRIRVTCVIALCVYVYTTVLLVVRVASTSKYVYIRRRKFYTRISGRRRF